MSVLKTMWDGCVRENPVFCLFLGLAPLVGVTHLAVNGVLLGLTTTVVFVLALVVGVLLRPYVPEGAHPILHIAALVVLTTAAHRYLAGLYPATITEIGVFLPLIVVNGFVMLTIDAKQPAVEAIAKGFGMGIGFTVVLVVVGVIREFMGFGTVFGEVLAVGDMAPFALAATVPGGLIVVGLLMALVNGITGRGGEIGDE